jgi:hypothetical protein
VTFRLYLLATTVLLLTACSKDSAPASTPSTPTSPAPTPATASFSVTFGQSPLPFRSSGCSFLTPQGWYTEARIQERSGVSFTVASLTQKLDGNPAGNLNESFGSRFGACSGSSFTPGTIAASGMVCGTVGVCTTGSFNSYQFSITGTDANGHAVTIDSPVLQLTR